MLKNRNILIFGDDWGRNPSTLQHLGRVFSEENRILWVGSLGMRKPKLRYSDIVRVFKKSMNIFSGIKHDVENSSVICTHPFIIPFHDNIFLRKINKVLLRKQLLKTMNDFDFNNPILITSTPFVHTFMASLGLMSSYYFCLDDYTKFDDAFKSLVEEEKELMEKVDGCFFVSDALISKHSLKEAKSFFLPQGVDDKHFMPLDLSQVPSKVILKKPVVGFFGLLSSWVDINLIVRCAEEYKGVSFLIIGKSTEDISKFSDLSNVTYLGEISYKELPSYVQEMDVGLIPFIVNELTVAANPLKLLEYLAMGIPVVSSALPEVKKFDDLVFVGNDNDHFVKLIAEAIKSNTPEKNILRRKEAQRYSWKEIAEKVSSVIYGIEKQKIINA